MNNLPTEALGFEKFLQQKGIIEKTISRHQREVNRYTNWLNNRGNNTYNATKKDLLEYLLHIKQSRQLSSATQNQILQTLKNYYAFLAREYEVNNITSLIKIRGKERERLTMPFTAEQLDLLLDTYYYHIKDYKPTAKELRFYPDQHTLLLGRYIALTLIAYQALRISEILSLTTDSFDLRKATITVPKSRRSAARMLPIEAAQMGVLIQYFAKQSVLVPNLNHFEKLSASLKQVFPKHTNLQHIRRSRITLWLKQHGLRRTQYLAGHKNILSTERYKASNFEALQNDLNSFHPFS